jgi:hypothetical protein
MGEPGVGALPKPGVIGIIPGIPADGFGGGKGSDRGAGPGIAPPGQLAMAIGKAQGATTSMASGRPMR